MAKVKDFYLYELEAYEFENIEPSEDLEEEPVDTEEDSSWGQAC